MRSGSRWRGCRAGDHTVPRQGHLHARGRKSRGTVTCRYDVTSEPRCPTAREVPTSQPRGARVPRSGGCGRCDAAAASRLPRRRARRRRRPGRTARSARRVAPRAGHQDRPAALGPGLQRGVGLLDQCGAAGDGGRGQARAAVVQPDGRDAARRWRRSRAAPGRRATTSGCGRPSPRPCALAASLWLPTVRRLKPLWLTNSVDVRCRPPRRSSGRASAARASPCRCRRTTASRRSARRRGGSSG